MNNDVKIWESFNRENKIAVLTVALTNFLTGIVFMILNFCGAVRIADLEINVSTIKTFFASAGFLMKAAPTQYIFMCLDLVVISIINVFSLIRAITLFVRMFGYGNVNDVAVKETFIKRSNRLPLVNMLNVAVCATLGSQFLTVAGKTVLILGIIVYCANIIVLTFFGFEANMRDKIVALIVHLMRAATAIVLFLLFFRPGVLDLDMILHASNEKSIIKILSNLISLCSVAGMVGLCLSLIKEDSIGSITEAIYSFVYLFGIIRSLFIGSFALTPYIFKLIPAALLFAINSLLESDNIHGVNIFQSNIRPKASIAVAESTETN